MYTELKALPPNLRTCECCGTSDLSPGGWCETCCSAPPEGIRVRPEKKHVTMRCPFCIKCILTIGRALTKHGKDGFLKKTKRAGFDIFAMHRHIGKSCPGTEEIRRRYLGLVGKKVGSIPPKKIGEIFPQIDVLARNIYNRDVSTDENSLSSPSSSDPSSQPSSPPSVPPSSPPDSPPISYPSSFLSSPPDSASDSAPTVCRQIKFCTRRRARETDSVSKVKLSASYSQHSTKRYRTISKMPSSSDDSDNDETRTFKSWPSIGSDITLSPFSLSEQLSSDPMRNYDGKNSNMFRSAEVQTKQRTIYETLRLSNESNELVDKPSESHAEPPPIAVPLDDRARYFSLPLEQLFDF
eukprot:jgi/Bigna1/132713/aug1.18_g7421